MIVLSVSAGSYTAVLRNMEHELNFGIFTLHLHCSFDE
jgi:hypothetical protein